jgi:sulfide:quinone oxidoreductase
MDGMSEHVLIVGGGVGALEALLALQALTRRVRISVVTATRNFSYPALSVAQPFGAAPPPRYDWKEIARDRGVEWVPDMLTAVRAGAREIDTRDGGPLGYDALLLALGARPTPALAGAITFAGPRDVLAVSEAIEELPAGRHHTVGFVAPPDVTWTLPLYELALLLAARARVEGLDVRVELVTHELRPLGAFGAQASGSVERRLSGAGISLRTGVHAEAVVAGSITVRQGEPIPVDLAIALPRLTGPAVPGLPHDADGFVPVDAYGRVRDRDGVWAVGDMTGRQIKQGGLAAQQADVAAASIAAGAGEPVEVVPYRPVLRGLLLTGDAPEFLEKGPGAPPRSRSSENFLWWPPQKVAGRHLAPYLQSLSAPVLPG